jgi:hypothetical protein
VSTCDKPRLAAESFHIHIKDLVAAGLLVDWGNLFIPIQNLECNSEIIHILPYRILLKSVVIFFVKPHTVIPNDINLGESRKVR